jgi:hypothetical protein
MKDIIRGISTETVIARSGEGIGKGTSDVTKI